MNEWKCLVGLKFWPVGLKRAQQTLGMLANCCLNLSFKNPIFKLLRPHLAFRNFYIFLEKLNTLGYKQIKSMDSSGHACPPTCVCACVCLYNIAYLPIRNTRRQIFPCHMYSSPRTTSGIIAPSGLFKTGPLVFAASSASLSGPQTPGDSFCPTSISP